MVKQLEYIPMASANITQNTSEKGKTDWIIKENITGTVLGSLPKNLKDMDALSILHLIRKYEEDAFNIGIKFGKDKSNKVLMPKIIESQEKHRLVVKENERLAEILDKEQNKINN